MVDVSGEPIDAAEFESSVRHVARQLYKHAISSGATTIDGRERDNIIDTGTEIIVIEATTSRKLEKIKTDLAKSVDLVRYLRSKSPYVDYNFRILLVTSSDPTADQNDYVRSAKAGCPKEIVSYSTLFSRLFDSRRYINTRSDHSFGSIRDPLNETDYKVPLSSYIPTALSQAGTGSSLKAADIAKLMVKGQRNIIFGDYGSGKSMTLRAIFFHLRDEFVSGASLLCPVYLNLREHIAQVQPDEALYRHAEKIGFPEPHNLIAAWRAGFVAIFLDGFDELTPPQFASSVDNLRQARRFAVELVKRFIEHTPKNAPIIIAGRESYFDSRDEAKYALGYNDSTNVFDLAGFTDQDIQRLLKTKGGRVPDWLPTRPLLLGYLANAGLLKQDDGILAVDPAAGWDEILQRVCEREVSQVWGVGFEARDLRQFVERLATHSRKTREAPGIQESDLKHVFHSVFGRDADEPAKLLALRLPGLGAKPGRPGAREFIDADFADAAASGDLSRFVDDPFNNFEPLLGVVTPLNDLGKDIVIRRLAGVHAKLSVALRQSAQDKKLSATTNDIINICTELHEGYKGSALVISDGDFDKLVLDDEVDLSRLEFYKCIFNVLDLQRSPNNGGRSSFPMLRDCVIDKVVGAISPIDMPEQMLLGSTSVELYMSYAETNDAIIKTSLPAPVRVLLTILRKLFLQKGTGRQYSALRRGLPLELTRFVDPVIRQVISKGFAEEISIDRRVIIMPNRSRSADALAIINGPQSSLDPLVMSVQSLAEK